MSVIDCGVFDDYCILTNGRTFILFLDGKIVGTFPTKEAAEKALLQKRGIK